MDNGQKIKILFISHDASLYGAQLSLLGLLSSLDRDSYVPYVVVPYRGALTEEIEKMSIPFFVRRINHWIPSRAHVKRNYFSFYIENCRSLRSRIWAVARLIERYNIDVVYTNTVTCIEGALAAAITKRPHIWHLRECVRGNQDLKSIIPQSIVSRLVAFLSDHVIVNSNTLRGVYNHSSYQNKTSVIYNGVDLAQFYNYLCEHLSLAKELNIDPASKMVAIIGAINPRKGHLTFVQSALDVKSSIQDVFFLVIGEGDGSFLSQVKSKVERLGLQKSFRFLGWRSDIPKILAAVDVLVVASEQEPFGRTIVEAMATGTPVVATRSGGPEEIVVDGETGYLVPVASFNAMGKAITRILQDTCLAYKFGAAAKERVEEFFSQEMHTKQVQSIISSVVVNRLKKPVTLVDD